MSADNTIGVMEFSDGEFRVAHFQNAEELCIDENGNVWGNIVPTKAFEFFRRAQSFKNKEIALIYADELLEEIGYVEYGVVEYYFPATWAEIVALQDYVIKITSDEINILYGWYIGEFGNRLAAFESKKD